jgi:O-antigen/teichoic acid export membrane protein
MSFSIGLLFISTKYLIFYLLPKYVESIFVIKILIFSVYFTSINQIAIRIIFASGRPQILIFLQIFAILINLILNFLFIKKGLGITGVAVATSLAYFFYSICVTHYILSKLYDNFFYSVQKQIKLYLPLIYCIVVLLLINFLPEVDMNITKNFLKDSVILLEKIFIMLIFYSPIAFYLIKITKKNYSTISH